MIAATRTRRATLKARRTQHQAAAKIRRQGVATLATHCIAAGLPVCEARSVAGSLRKAAKKVAVTGIAARAHAGRHMRNCRKFSVAEVNVIVMAYRPRKPAYKLAAAKLALAA